MSEHPIVPQLAQNSKLIEYLRENLNKQINVERHLEIADKYYIQGKSTTDLSYEYRISASRISDMLDLYKTKIAPLLVRILNDEEKEEEK